MTTFRDLQLPAVSDAIKYSVRPPTLPATIMVVGTPQEQLDAARPGSVEALTPQGGPTLTSTESVTVSPGYNKTDRLAITWRA